MGKLRFYTALLIAQFIHIAIKILRRSGGTSFVGMIALKICPDFLTYCNKYIKYKSITVTGTNGKTTTSGILAKILSAKKHPVLHNVKGANMLTGITNVFATSTIPLRNYDYAVLESDEAYLNKLYDKYNADYLLVTNLFRDQLDRYGELSTTASFIQKAIDKNKKLKLFLNADDPLVSNFGKNRESVYYGFQIVETYIDNNRDIAKSPTENFKCPCGNNLEYDVKFFAQEGHYYCTSCGYARPEPDYKGYAKIYDTYSKITVEHNDMYYDFTINLSGLYNAYNALGAISCALECGIPPERIKNAVDSYKSIFGRTERRIINGKNAIIQLIKNPTGASEVLKTVDLKSNIVIAINDNYADGRDISWLWDSDFEQLKDIHNKIIASGTRAKDVAVRLKYAGIAQDNIIIEENIKSAILQASKAENSENKITILPSYTALLKINKMKFKKGKKK